MFAHPALLTLLSRQDGLVSVAQARCLGVPERTLRGWVDTRGWQRVEPRVYLAGGHRYGSAARVRAAGLWAGPPAVVSGAAAAWWHAMVRDRPREVQVTVPHRRGLRSRPGIGIRRRDLAAADRTTVHGLSLTALPLTALETAAALPDGSVFLDRALQRHVRFEDVYGAYCRGLGAHGASRIATLLTAAADRADSAAERLMIGLLRGAGITGWHLGHPFGPWTVDIAFPAERIAIEVDGWAWHVDVDRFRADRHKDNALARAGWELLRFTWHDLENRPAYVLETVRAALRMATARPA